MKGLSFFKFFVFTCCLFFVFPKQILAKSKSQKSSKLLGTSFVSFFYVVSPATGGSYHGKLLRGWKLESQVPLNESFSLSLSAEELKNKSLSHRWFLGSYGLLWLFPKDPVLSFFLEGGGLFLSINRGTSESGSGFYLGCGSEFAVSKHAAMEVFYKVLGETIYKDKFYDLGARLNLCLKDWCGILKVENLSNANLFGNSDVTSVELGVSTTPKILKNIGKWILKKIKQLFTYPEDVF